MLVLLVITKTLLAQTKEEVIRIEVQLTDKLVAPQRYNNPLEQQTLWIGKTGHHDPQPELFLYPKRSWFISNRQWEVLHSTDTISLKTKSCVNLLGFYQSSQSLILCHFPESFCPVNTYIYTYINTYIHAYITKNYISTRYLFGFPGWGSWKLRSPAVGNVLSYRCPARIPYPSLGRY